MGDSWKNVIRPYQEESLFAQIFVSPANGWNDLFAESGLLGESGESGLLGLGCMKMTTIAFDGSKNRLFTDDASR